MKRSVASVLGRGFCEGILLGLVALLAVSCREPGPGSGEGEFLRLSREGKKFYDAGQAEKAMGPFEEAVKLKPASVDARLNLANAWLLVGQAEKALGAARKALEMDPDSAAARYLIGCAQLRSGDAESAAKVLAEVKELDPTINAVSYQLARAQAQQGHFGEAVTNLEEVVEFEPGHLAAHYNLSQAYLRLARTDDAALELVEHQKVMEAKGNTITDPAEFERCRYTKILVPFRLEQPARPGIRVSFVDATEPAFGGGASRYGAPLAVLNLRRDGWQALLVREGAAGFRLLNNVEGNFDPTGELLPGLADGGYGTALVGDLDNDRLEEVLVLGEGDSRLFRFTTNGVGTDITRRSRLDGVRARSGLLVDLDYTGKLDLLLLGPGTNGFRALRNLGRRDSPSYFMDVTTNFNLGAETAAGRRMFVEDWNEDELLDILVTAEGVAPVLLARGRDGRLAETNGFPDWAKGTVLAVGDLNNDLRPDLVMQSGEGVFCVMKGEEKPHVIGKADGGLSGLVLLDYDNDGWLDLVGHGQGLRVWRNLGESGFEEATKGVGLGEWSGVEVTALEAADFDGDCDTDLVMALGDRGIRLLRNEGGNANYLLRLDLVGTKSNASALGIRLEIAGDGLRMSRRVSDLPVEIGVGRNAVLDSVTVEWFDFTQSTVDVRADDCSVLRLTEFQKQTGSCPYLYAWAGDGFRFVTDLLGGSPLGLPEREGRWVDADPDEYVWIGGEEVFPLRDGEYVLQVTEELREVLYLDSAKLVVVDHPPGTEVYTTGKLLPGKPFPPARVLTLTHPRELRGAFDGEGRDVKGLLMKADGQYVSPVRLREPQLRGLAEPYSVTLDFGPLAVEKPLVLAINGWLRFGGGSVNVAASRSSDLPFPFPTLEVETRAGLWQRVDVVVGAPAGKTKSFVVELAGRLPPGSGRLRLTSGFEIHWDRIALLEETKEASTRVETVGPAGTDLHWRGFGEDAPLPWNVPIAPRYDRVRSWPMWSSVPTGWSTSYGEVDELLAEKDNTLVILNSGDELTLRFREERLAGKPEGYLRDFFLHTVGWDKDANIHCELGWQVEPLPWHGMDYQRYGREQRPALPNDGWIRKYNTRWSGPVPGGAGTPPPGGSAVGFSDPSAP